MLAVAIFAHGTGAVRLFNPIRIKCDTNPVWLWLRALAARPDRHSLEAGIEYSAVKEIAVAALEAPGAHKSANIILTQIGEHDIAS